MLNCGTPVTLVFIHGFLGDPSDWDEVRVRIDSPSTAIRIPNVGEWNTTVATIAANLPNNCTLVGYSMGGRLAIGAALSASDKVRRLVVVSGNPGISDTKRAERKQHDRKIANELRNCTSEQAKRSFLGRWYRQPVFHGLDETQIETLIAKRLALDEHRMADLLRQLSIANQPDYRVQLKESNIDILFVAGDRDKQYVALAEDVAQLSARIDYKIIPGCGHLIPFEQPNWLGTSISQFLKNSD